MNIKIKEVTLYWCINNRSDDYNSYLHKDLVWRTNVYEDTERDGLYNTKEDAESTLHQFLLGDNRYEYENCQYWR